MRLSGRCIPRRGPEPCKSLRLRPTRPPRPIPFAPTAGRLRGTFLGIDGLEARARALAGRFTLAPPSRQDGRQFFQRLADNSRALRAAYHTLAEDVRRGEPVAPAAEWLLDNFHLLEAEIVGILHHLPRRYYSSCRSSPRASAAGIAAHPRHRARSHPAQRRPARARSPDPLHQRLSDGRAAHHRRAVGLADHAKAALIENIRRLAEDIAADRGAAGADAVLFRALRSRGRARKVRVPTLPQSLGSPIVVQLLSSACASRVRRPPSSGSARAVAGRMGISVEEAVRAEHTAASHGPRLDGQFDHEPAASAPPSTGAERRAVSLVEQSPAARSGRRLRPDGFPEPGSLPPGGRGAGGADRRGPGQGRAAGGRERAPGAARRTPASARRTSAIT